MDDVTGNRLFIETDGIAIADREADITNHIHWSMWSIVCPWCGAVDGMEAWSRENVHDARSSDDYLLPQLYRFAPRPLEEHEHLFSPCPECNRGGDVDEEQYVVISDRELSKWMKRGN